MKVIVDNVVQELTYMDKGDNIAEVIVGNMDRSLPHKFDKEQGAYVMFKDEYDYWVRVLQMQTEVDERMQRLADIHGAEAVTAAVKNVTTTEHPQYQHAINDALDMVFGVGS